MCPNYGNQWKWHLDIYNVIPPHHIKWICVVTMWDIINLMPTFKNSWRGWGNNTGQGKNLGQCPKLWKSKKVTSWHLWCNFCPSHQVNMCGNNLGHYNFYAHFYVSLWVQKEAEGVRAIIWGMARIWDKVSQISKSVKVTSQFQYITSVDHMWWKGVVRISVFTQLNSFLSSSKVAKTCLGQWRGAK